MRDQLLGAANQIERIHFVGIGGIGMSGIAKILAAAGFKVSGSDLHAGPMIEELKGAGVRVFVGHDATHVGDAQAVVYSSAVPARNPELVEAQSRAIPRVHRSEMLAEIMRFKAGISISGTHGKTTVTGMTASVLLEAGLDPTVVVGARVPSLGGNARLGSGSYFVAEADESDRTFLRLPGLCNVVTNIDLDHMDVYHDLADLRGTFLRFLDQVPFQGRAIACLDDPQLATLIPSLDRPSFTYGTGSEADLRAEEIELDAGGCSYQCRLGGQALGLVRLKVGGRHNVLNSLAALSVAVWLGVPFETAARALEKYQGAERRLQWKGEANGIGVVDDYAHHPTEIQAALEAASHLGRRLFVVFQPHRYTRTAALMEATWDCFEAAQKVYLMDVYSAGERPLPGVTSERLAQRISPLRAVSHLSSPDALLETLKRDVGPGDLILTLGAGDVWKIGERFLEENNG